MRTVGIVIPALVVCAIGLLGCVGLDGDTYSIDLVNDTAEPLEFAMCSDGAACDSPRFDSWVDPGGPYSTVGTVDIVSWYRVRDEAGDVVGCFKLDFVDERPPKGTELLASEIGPCPS